MPTTPKEASAITAIQELIAQLKKLSPSPIATDASVSAKGFHEGLQWAILKATSLLDKEREQIVKAHTEGQALIVGLCEEHLGGFDETMEEIKKARSGNDNDVKAEDYFTNTFSQ